MKEATLITAKFESVLIHNRQDYIKRAQMECRQPRGLIDRDTGDIALPVDGNEFSVINIPIKRFCIEEPLSSMGAQAWMPPEYRDIKEVYVAMDPMIQQCFEGEMNTVRFEAQMEIDDANRRSQHLQSEIDRIKGMSAWEVAKAAWAKLWSRK